VIEIPTKRHERKLISYLDLDEIKALLAAPDPGTWHGRRDHALLLFAVQTGLRVSEFTGLRLRDITLDADAHCRVTAKDARNAARCSPPTQSPSYAPGARNAKAASDDPLFPTRQGRPLTPKAVAWLLDKHTLRSPHLPAPR
jgi:integrase/recombinase XerD